jgi:hypothetical protein
MNNVLKQKEHVTFTVRTIWNARNRIPWNVGTFYLPDYMTSIPEDKICTTWRQSLKIIVFMISTYLCTEYLMTLSAFRLMQWIGVRSSEHWSRMGVEETGHVLHEAPSWHRYGGLGATRRILKVVDNLVEILTSWLTLVSMKDICNFHYSYLAWRTDVWGAWRLSTTCQWLIF